jgi:hypothetical protein
MADRFRTVFEPAARFTAQPNPTPTISNADNQILDKALEIGAPLSPGDRERLAGIARDLQARGMPRKFILSALRSTSDVMLDLQDEQQRTAELFERNHVRQFVEQNAVTIPPRQERYTPRSERKREERERLQANAQRLLREARQARGRHEVKKTRNMLLKLDQREMRRVLGGEGDDLCRQINTWLRSTASMF